MTEELIAPSPAAASPVASPTASPSPAVAPVSAPVKTGTSALMDDMETVMGKPEAAEPDKEPAKPEKAAEPAKSAVPPKDESGKFVAKPKDKDEPHGRDPNALRKRLAEVEADLNKTRAEKESTVAELQRKMSDLEKRPFLTDDQRKRYESLETRSKELEAELAAVAYANTEDYRNKYQKRWQAKYESSVREVGRLQVKSVNADTGEESTRPASQQDFERVRALRSSEAAQLDEAERIFGNRASLVVKYCNELDGIEQQANEEVATRRQKYDEEMAQKQSQQGETQKTMQTAAQARETELLEKYPEWFGKSEDPEMESAMKQGLDYVDSASTDINKLPPDERGKRLAVIRLWAGSFPRNVRRIQALEAKLAEREAKIAKLQGTDPGAGGDAPSPDKLAETVVGTAGLAAEF
jgi:hypothetical protein